MTVRPGWYPDPAEPTTQRYWDGDGWIGEPLPADATPPPGPPPVEPEPVAGSTAPASPPATGVRTPDRPTTGVPATGPTSAGPTSAGPTSTWPTSVPPAGYVPTAPGTPPAAPTSGANGVPPVGAATPTSGPAGPPPGYPMLPPGYPPPPHFRLPPGQVPGWYPPYRFPMPEPRPHGLALAPLPARLLARLVDITLVLLLNVLVNGWFVWRYAQEMGPFYRELVRQSWAGNPRPEDLPPVSPQAEWLLLVILLLATALWFAYEVPAVANNGQTVGKRLLGLRVMSIADTERLGFGRSMRRWNTLGLPTFFWYCCGIGFLLQLIDCAFVLFDRPLRLALHDRRAQTVVVQVARSTGTPAAPSAPDRTDISGGPKS